MRRDLGEYGWFNGNSSRTHPVGQKKPNGFGLHDMHGNVCGVVLGLVRRGLLQTVSRGRPDWPRSRVGLGRVFRGGSWYDGPARRPVGEPATGTSRRTGHATVGFRLALGQSGR